MAIVHVQAKMRQIDPRRITTGSVYLHPDLGPVQIIAGSYLREGRVSNFWEYRVLETGEIDSGYGHFFEAPDEYATATLSRAQWQQLIDGDVEALQALKRQIEHSGKGKL